MIQAYNKMSDHNDKELYLHKSSWDTVPNTQEISMLITENAAGGIKED
jgi:hypothetical protein